MMGAVYSDNAMANPRPMCESSGPSRKGLSGSSMRSLWRDARNGLGNCAYKRVAWDSIVMNLLASLGLFNFLDLLTMR